MIQEQRSFRSKYILYGIMVFAMVGIGSIGYYYFASSSFLPLTITPYDPKQDQQQVLDIFKQDWHWLILGGDYDHSSALYYLDVNAPKHRAKRLKVFVMRQGNNCIGFISLFMVSPRLGRLQFLAIDKKFRGHKYGEQLFRYGVQQLLSMGSQRVELLVRPTNIPAQKLYKKVGFYEIAGYKDLEDGVYFEYDPLKAALPVSSASRVEPVAA